MKTKNTIILILGLIILSIGCDKSKISSRNPEILILGTWEWEKTETEIPSGEIELYTPESENYTETFIFETDSAFFIYRDEVLTRQGNYWLDSAFYLTQGQIAAREELHLFLDEQSGTKTMKVEFEDNYKRLILDSIFGDFSTSTFLRVGE